MLKLLLIIGVCFGFGFVHAGTYRTTNAVNSEPLNWNSSASWVGGTVPPSNQNASHKIYIDHDITRTGGWTFRNDKLFFADNVVFKVTGNVNVNKLTITFTANSSSKLVIEGNIKVFYSKPFTIGTGTVLVKGNFSNTGQSSINNEGVLKVVGNLSVTNGSVHRGSGDLFWGTGSIGQGKIGQTGCYGNNTTLPSSSGINLATCGAVLPVQFLSFTASCTNEGVSLDWVTASERDNSHFEIQKASNSLDFEPIEELEGVGTTSSESIYNFTDIINENSTIYYRLKQVDYNGDFDYSKTVFATCAVLNTDFSVYPTVSSGEYTLSFNKDIEFLSIQVLNQKGEVVEFIDFINAENNSKFVLDITTSEGGIYYLKVRMNNQVESTRIVKQ